MLFTPPPPCIQIKQALFNDTPSIIGAKPHTVARELNVCVSLCARTYHEPFS